MRRFFQYHANDEDWHEVSIPQKYADETGRIPFVLLIMQRIYACPEDAYHEQPSRKVHLMAWTMGMKQAERVKAIDDENNVCLHDGRLLKGYFIAPVPVDVFEETDVHHRERMACVPYLWTVWQGDEGNPASPINASVDIIQINLSNGEPSQRFKKLRWNMAIQYEKSKIVSQPPTFKEDTCSSIFGHTMALKDTYSYRCFEEWTQMPREVTAAAVRCMAESAESEFGFKPQIISEMFGKKFIAAMAERPLDPNVAYFRDFLPWVDFDKSFTRDCTNNFPLLCKALDISNPPASMKKAYAKHPANLIIYVLMKRIGFSDINIIRQFFDAERFFSEDVLNLTYETRDTWEIHNNVITQEEIDALLHGRLRPDPVRREIKKIVLRNDEQGQNKIAEPMNFFSKHGELSAIEAYYQWVIEERGEVAAGHLLLKSNKENERIVRDTLRLFYDLRGQYEYALTGKLKELFLYNGITQETHDYAARELRRYKYGDVDSTPIIYTDEQKKYATEIDGHVFELPKVAGELVNYSNQFNNCVASYMRDVARRLITVVVMKKDDAYEACIEVDRSGNIVQVLGKDNRRLSSALSDVVAEWASQCGLAI